jgi:hypothetical protein
LAEASERLAIASWEKRITTMVVTTMVVGDEAGMSIARLTTF